MQPDNQGSGDEKEPAELNTAAPNQAEPAPVTCTSTKRIEYVLSELQHPNRIHANGRTLLMEVAELWLDKHEAVEIAKYLLEHDTDLNAVDKRGDTALILAAKANDLPLLMYLAEHGADIGARSHDGDTAWSWAVRRGSTDMMQYLQLRGACPDECDNIETAHHT